MSCGGQIVAFLSQHHSTNSIWTSPWLAICKTAVKPSSVHSIRKKQHVYYVNGRFSYNILRHAALSERCWGPPIKVSGIVMGTGHARKGSTTVLIIQSHQRR